MKFLKVPYADKDQAKALGARWNPDRKAWYVPDGVALAPFEQWASAGLTGAPGLPGNAVAAGAKLRVDSYAGKPVAGVHFIELEHDCDPFVECLVCRPQLERSGWMAAHAISTAMLRALPPSDKA